MKNTIKHSLKNIGTGILLSLAVVGTTKESIAQNLSQNIQGSVKTEIDISKEQSPLLRVDNNVGKYYPSLENHYFLLKNAIWTKDQEDAINDFLEKNIVENIEDLNQRMLAIMYCMEVVVNFGNTYIEKKIVSIANKSILKENVKFLFAFRKDYNDWYNLNKEKIEIELNKKLASKKEELASKKEELASKKEELASKKEEGKKVFYNYLNKITLQDMKSNSEIYNRVKEAKEIFTEFNLDYSDNQHVVELFNAVK